MSKRHMRMLALWCSLCCLAAAAGCSQKPPLKYFKSDGCSLFPDRSLITEEDWCTCCFEHDVAYWQGGDKAQRKAADLALKACIMEKTQNRALADLMYKGVRMGGSPHFPTWYRWGYGWRHMRGYQPFSAEEKRLVLQKLQAFDEDKNTCRAEKR